MLRPAARVLALPLVLGLSLIVSTSSSVRASESGPQRVLSTPAARGAMAFAYDATRDEIIMFGGCCDTNHSNKPFSDTWRWTPDVGWSLAADAGEGPGCRSSTRMVFDVTNEVIVLFGGFGRNVGCNGAATRQNDTWIWDGTTWDEQDPASRPGIRESMAMAWDPRDGGSVAFFGGDGKCGTGGGSIARCDDAWTWANGNWTMCLDDVDDPCETRPDPRTGASFAYSGHYNLMFMAGGTTGMLQEDTWIWKGVEDGWVDRTDQVDTFGPRFGHRMAFDPNVSPSGAILLFGGCIGNCPAFGDSPQSTSTVNNDAWSLDGGTWAVKTDPDSDPTDRCCSGMAMYDAADFPGDSLGHIVLYGGQSGDNIYGLGGVWYWVWNGQDGAWVACDGANDACT